MLSSSSLFETLPERPPTPPRDVGAHPDDALAVNEALHFLENGHAIETAGDVPQILHSETGSDVPIEHSPSSQDLSNTNRRVEFSPYPKFHPIARLGQISSPAHQLHKRSPLNRHAKPRRSILKPSTFVLDPPTPDELENRLGYFSPQDPGSFAKMLQSAIQHLGSVRQDARLDAYLALNNAIKAYDGVIPDVQAMAVRMDVIMQFLSRDMVWKNPSGSLDTNMVTQSLKLIAAIMFVPTLLDAWDDDFRTFLIDRSTAVMESTESSKAIIKMHMYILAHQRFRSASVMTSARADRIVTTLQNIDERCSGNTAVATRLIIYLRLLEQTPAVMMTRSRDWLEHTFHGMLSSITDIRIRAVDLCQAAGLVLGQHPHGAKPIREMLETEMEEGKTYGDYLHERLMQMISDPEAGAFVPRIWGAVLLFFRHKRSQVERWARFKTWLLIIQKCLNSSDLNVKYNASRAWNTLVFVVSPDGSMGGAMRTMLRTPVVAGLRRRNNAAHAQQEHQIAMETYYNLLHYSLRPGLPHEDLDSAWDTYVEPILSEQCEASMKGRATAFQVLRGLLTATPGTWNPNAANELDPIKPEELPKLDPRWVRTRLSKVLEILEPSMLDSMWKAQELNDDLDATLEALYACIVEASGQEVRTSSELKEAIAVLVNLLQRLWREGTHAPAAKAATVLSRFEQLVVKAVRSVGLIAFAEDILVKTKEDAVEAMSTPSHRPLRHQASPHSPLLLLFGLLYQPPATFLTGDALDGLLKLGSKILELLTCSKQTSAAQIELLNRSMQATSSLPLPTMVRSVPALLWTCIANQAADILEVRSVRPDSHDSQTLGRELRNVISILTPGLAFVAEEPACLNTIFELYDAALLIAKSRAGICAIALAITEPFAEALANLPPSVSVFAKLPMANRLLSTVVWPRTYRDLEQSRKALWGVSLTPHKPSVFEPFVKTNQLISQLLVSAYASFSSLTGDDDIETTLAYLDSSVAFLGSCPPSHLVTTFRKIQNGFVSWIKGEAVSTTDDRISEKVHSIWQSLLKLLHRLPQYDSPTLEALEPLLVAGLSSPHRSVVNESILFWNRSFGDVQNLQYPERLERVLRTRSLDTNISLPCLPEHYGTDSYEKFPAFYDSPGDGSSGRDVSKSAFDGTRIPGTVLTPKSAYLTASRTISSACNMSIASPLRRSIRSSAHSTPKARLRHNDSQVQFATIDSSPLRPAEESQHLTEHQQEVLSKQHEDAQMFPDLSSSPFRERSVHHDVQKRLDFTSRRMQTGDDEEGTGTPPGLPNAHGLLSDDLPSSPTPSSSKGGSDPSRVDADGGDDLADEGIVDPPSSPPRKTEDDHCLLDQEQDEADEDDTVVEVLSSINEQVEDLPSEPILGDSHDPALHFPSDLILPTLQLQEEEQAAVDATVAVFEAGPEHAQIDENDDQDAEVNSNEAFSTQAEVTRVEDSFVHHVAADLASEQDSRSVEGSQMTQGDGQSPPKTRKRKRSGEIVYTAKAAKKRKSQSPFKMAKSFFSSFLGQSQENDLEDDEDIGDEIVVASSQYSSPPAKNTAKMTAVTEKESDPKNTKSTDVEPLTTDDRTPPPGQATKRRSGRPKKSPTPVPMSDHPIDAPGSAKKLKRKASALNKENVGTETIDVVEDTPAPPRTRRQHQVASQQAQDDVVSTTKVTSRRLASVEIPRVEPEVDDDFHRVDDAAALADEVEVEAEIPARQAAQAVCSPRRIATPKSIIGRLRDVLGDLRKSVLGRSEERDLDDILFELRKEVHDAAGRGRSG